MEILATIPVYTYPMFLNLLLAAAIIIMIVGAATFLGSFISRSVPSFLTAFFISIIIIVVGIIGFKHTNKAMDRTSVLDYTKYKVTINETITARELLDKYEILSREGEIFTIKEIEVDE